jgi:hypothetical protein
MIDYTSFLFTKIGQSSVPISYGSDNETLIYPNGYCEICLNVSSDHRQVIFGLYHELGHYSLMKYSFMKSFYHYFYQRPWKHWKKLICSLEEVRAWRWAKKELQKTKLWKDASFRNAFRLYRKEWIRTYLEK